MSKQELIFTIKSNNDIIANNEQEIQSKDQEIQLYKYQIEELKRQLFGQKREQFISNQGDKQLSLPFNLPGSEEETTIIEEEIKYVRKKRSKKNHAGRNPLPSHLPVKETVIEPEESTEGLKCIGKEVTDKLEYTPGKFYINRIIRPKYVKDNDDKTKSTILIGDLPEFAIYKGIAGNMLIAWIFVQKFVGHLPFYRQQQIFKRNKIDIHKSTINNWQIQIARLLSPLYEKMIMYVKRQGYIQADETTIKVLDQTKKGKTHLGYYWVYYAVLQDILIFDYQKGRGKSAPKGILQGFTGYLQTDGYAVYNGYAKKKGITHVGCMAHARRKFEKALSNDKGKAGFVMLKIQKLYEIERMAKEKDLNYKQIKELRLDKALPILNEIGGYLYNNINSTLPKSPIGLAMSYFLARIESLRAYLYDGLYK